MLPLTSITKDVHTLPLPFSLLLRILHAYLCLYQVAALWLAPRRARHGLFTWQSPAQRHLPPLSNLVFCLMSHSVISFLLFFLPLPPDAHFYVKFYCFPGLCPPAPGVLYTKIALKHRITWKKEGKPLALPLLPS